MVNYFVSVTGKLIHQREAISLLFRENLMNNLMLKRIIIALTILYVLSPLDLAPGPLDDIIIMVLGVAFSSVVGDKNRTKS